MNDSSSDIPDEEIKYFPGDDSKKIPGDTSPEILSDGIFTIKISEDMALRNALRSGLVEAQGSDTDGRTGLKMVLCACFQGIFIIC